MNRHKFIIVTLAIALLLTTSSLWRASNGLAGNENKTIPTRVISIKPPLRWEDAMISGNGSTGIMFMGLPLEDLVIVYHEKLWMVGNNYRPQTPDLSQV